MTIGRPIGAPTARPIIDPLAPGALPWEAPGGGVDLAASILAILTGAGWDVFFLGLARGTADFSLVSGAVATWLDRSGRGNHATQSTGSARPTYSASAINSLPGMTLDGGDYVITGNIDVSSYTSHALMILGSDTDTALRVWGEHGEPVSATGLSVRVNGLAAGDVYARARGDVGATEAVSAASYAMTSPQVLTATWDRALSTDEVTIRHAGSNVTNSRPSNSNNTVGIASQPLAFGARSTGASGMTGAIGGAVYAVSTSAISGARLSALSQVEALLAASKGL